MTALPYKLLNLIAPIMFLVFAACNTSSVLGDKEQSERLGKPIDTTPVVFDAVTSFERLNRVRSRHALRPFRSDPRLMAAARNHAELMGATGRFGHEFGPDTVFNKKASA